MATCPSCERYFALELEPALALPPTGGDYEYVDGSWDVACPHCLAWLRVPYRYWLQRRRLDIGTVTPTLRRPALALVRRAGEIPGHLGAAVRVVGHYRVIRRLDDIPRVHAAVELTDGTRLPLTDRDGDPELRWPEEYGVHANRAVLAVGTLREARDAKPDAPGWRLSQVQRLAHVPGELEPPRKRRRHRKRGHPGSGYVHPGSDDADSDDADDADDA